MTRTRNRRKSRSARKQILSEWNVEIIASLCLLLGIFLIVEDYNIRETTWALTNQLIDWVAAYLGTHLSELLESALRPSNLLAVVLLVVSISMLWKRIRSRLLQAAAQTPKSCPRCGHSIHKQHRRNVEHLLSYFIPMRRYHCRQCGWKGLQVYVREADVVASSLRSR